MLTPGHRDPHQGEMRHRTAPPALALTAAFLIAVQMLGARTPEHAAGIIVCGLGLVMVGLAWQQVRPGGTRDLMAELDELDHARLLGRETWARGDLAIPAAPAVAGADTPAMCVTAVNRELVIRQLVTVEQPDGKHRTVRGEELARWQPTGLSPRPVSAPNGTSVDGGSAS